MADNETHQTAKRLFEEDNMSKAAIARQLNVSPQTIGKWSKVDNWGGQGGGNTAAETNYPASVAFVVGVGETTDAPSDLMGSDLPPKRPGNVSLDEAGNDIHSAIMNGPVVTEPPSSVAELQTEIIALQAKNDDLTKENDRLNPTIDIHDWLEDRVAWLTTETPEGDRYWINRAEQEWVKMTRERIASNLPPFDIKSEPKMFQKTIDDLKAKEAAAYDAEPTEPASRKIKLAIYRGGKDANDSVGGMLTIEQIPLEGQINNTAGSLADGIIRYTRKGFKITDPFLCPRAGCFKPAAVDPFNKWQWDGYHSEAHRNEVEVDQDIDLTGVIVRDHGVLSGAS